MIGKTTITSYMWAKQRPNSVAASKRGLPSTLRRNQAANAPPGRESCNEICRRCWRWPFTSPGLVSTAQAAAELSNTIPSKLDFFYQGCMYI